VDVKARYKQLIEETIPISPSVLSEGQRFPPFNDVGGVF
jgi:hypothetical protein